MPKDTFTPRASARAQHEHTLLDKESPGIVKNPSLYGSHSYRRGGITAVVKARVDMLLIARHGNWRSTAVYLYVSDSLQRKLSVSKSIREASKQPRGVFILAWEDNPDLKVLK